MNIQVLKKHGAAVMITFFVSYALVILYLMFLAPSEELEYAHASAGRWTLVLAALLYAPIYWFFIRRKREESAYALVRNWIIGVTIVTLIFLTAFIALNMSV